jgi:UDP-N-acetylmuramoyl-L-alanyl-D-glutamate--2,6-diaminopimelate ligase
LKLTNILTPIYKELSGNFQDIEIDNLCLDTRKLKDNCLFLLMEGEHYDPHNNVTEIEKSVSFFISEKPILTDVPYLIDPDLKEKVGFIYSNFLNNPESKMEHIGITGTNGKTSIASIIQYIFQDIYKTSYIGTLGLQINGSPVESNFDTPTTPQASDLVTMIKELADENVAINVMEVSSHSLFQKRVVSIDFSYAIFSNLTVDHLDYHGTFEEYAESKKLLFDSLSSQSVSIINADDPNFLRMVQDTKSEVITYSIFNDSDLKASNIHLNKDGTSFDVTYKNRTITFQTKLIGNFNVYNLLSVIALCFIKNLPIAYVKEKIFSFSGIPGRLEKVNSSVRSIFVDYAHTPDGLESVLKALNELKGLNSIITVFGCGGDRDSSKRPMMGSIADELSDLTIITSDNPRTEDPEKILDDISKGFSGEYFRIVDRKEAIRKAINLSSPGDLILVAGKGHEDYQIIGNTKIDFDDRKISQELLEELFQITDKSKI